MAPRRIFHSDDPDAPIINHIFTDKLFIAYSSVGGMIHAIDDEDYIHDLSILHTCIQNDPGVPNTWKDAVNGIERD